MPRIDDLILLQMAITVGDAAVSALPDVPSDHVRLRFAQWPPRQPNRRPLAPVGMRPDKPLVEASASSMAVRGGVTIGATPDVS
jgi:hypothetical protein